MRGRTAALGLAAVLTMTLTSCGVRSEADRGTDTDRLRSGQTEQDLIRSGRTMLKDGSYYAGTDGEVDRVRPERESEWEKLGRDLRDGWDHLMNGTEEAAERTGRAAEQVRQGCGGGRRTRPGGGRPGVDRKVTCAGIGRSLACEPSACGIRRRKAGADSYAPLCPEIILPSTGFFITFPSSQIRLVRV